MSVQSRMGVTFRRDSHRRDHSTASVDLGLSSPSAVRHSGAGGSTDGMIITVIDLSAPPTHWYWLLLAYPCRTLISGKHTLPSHYVPALCFS